MPLDISQFGKGMLHKPDERDFVFGASATPPFDWSMASDDDEYFTIKSQGPSLSCVAQTAAEMSEQLEGTERSAHAVYAQIHLPGGNAFLSDGMDVLTKQIIQREQTMPSQPATEAYMEDSTGLVVTKRQHDWAYALVTGGIDAIAAATRDHKCVMFGVQGSNNTWHTPDVQPGSDWGHAIKGFRPVMRNGKKTIKFQNHWSADWANKGYGYLDEDYVHSGITTYVVTNNFTKPVPYSLKNPKIALANPQARANPFFINALFKERFGRYATLAEQWRFATYTVRDAANIVLGRWRSPFFGQA